MMANFLRKRIIPLCFVLLVVFFVVITAIPVAIMPREVARAQLAYASNSDGDWDIYMIDLEGQLPLKITYSHVNEERPTWSADGSLLAYIISYLDGRQEIAVWSAATGDIRYYPLAGHSDSTLHFSADDRQIIISSPDTPERVLDLVTGVQTLLRQANTPSAVVYSSWSFLHPVGLTQRDQNPHLLFTASDGRTSSLFLVDQNGRQRLATHESSIFTPSLSSDERYVAYASGQTGTRRLYVLDIITGEQQMVVHDGHDINDPVWRFQ